MNRLKAVVSSIEGEESLHIIGFDYDNNLILTKEDIKA